MDAESFPAFYRGVHGRDPFPWQVRLAREVTTTGWPTVLDLPTAAGKTTVIDVAVFDLARQAGLPLHERTAPIRIFFVIDRRLVVDQAAEHARDLRTALEHPDRLPASPAQRAVVEDVAARLRLFGGRPLHTTALRGGMYRDETWTRSPCQPTVCVSTVDQVGSRLLFRGYGVSEYARPVHAALTGNDALYLLDEAHLSQPFLDTLRAVERYRDPGGPWAPSPTGGPFRVVELSATPVSAGTRFNLDAEDLANPELHRRLTATKPARFLEPSDFEAEAVRQAQAIMTGDVKVVGVVVNRVASARAIFELLPGDPFEDKVLLTGRIRPWDRDRLLTRCLDRMRAGRTRTPDDRPFWVVATMTVEVGADLDFDHLVSEAAPLSALRQRFGRLDRLGRFGHAAGTVLLRKSRRDEPDPVYGDDLRAAWDWLQSASGTTQTVDFGVLSFKSLLESTLPPQPTERCAPVLLPAHLDLWSQTSPVPRPDPDVAPFLHGAEALNAADVQVLWRADLHRGAESDWIATVAAAPPRSREALALPLPTVVAWLRDRSLPDLPDLEGVTGAVERGTGKPALRWLGPEMSEVIGPDGIRPGDTLVVPSTYGGGDAFGWFPRSTDPVGDVGDQVVDEMANEAPGSERRLVRVRMYPGLEQESTEGPAFDPALRALKQAIEDGDDPEEPLDDVLGRLRERPLADPLLAASLAALAAGRPNVMSYPAGVVLTGRVSPGFFAPSARGEEEEAEDVSDADDTTSVRAGVLRPVAVPLADHCTGVADHLARYARTLGLDDKRTDALVRAAHLHDVGKADWRFQYMLYGDEPRAVPLAKSDREFDPATDRLLRNQAGLPRGFRHELVSVALLRAHRDVLLNGMPEGSVALAEYLVGSHHGRGRPFVPFIPEVPSAPLVVLDWKGHRLCALPDHRLWHLGSGWADLYWSMARTYGWWGLPYLESLLRLADAARSAEEQHADG